MSAVQQALRLRVAGLTDLPALNAVIEHAVMRWNLPERVKRLALPGYRYSQHDLRELHLLLAEDDGSIVGVAAWEPASPHDVPPGQRGLLLHGLYIEPQRQSQGVGKQLLAAAVAAAREHGFDGIVVKAQADAQGYFEAQGFAPMAVQDAGRDYQHRLWKHIT